MFKTPRAYSPILREFLAGDSKWTGEGDSTHVGLFIPLPAELAKQYPSLGVEDSSPPHVTLLSVGEVPPQRMGEFVSIVKGVLDSGPKNIRAAIVGVDSFVHPHAERTVFYTPIHFSCDMGTVRDQIASALSDAGFEVDNSFPLAFNPHTTLEYRDGLVHEHGYGKPVPHGAWDVDEIQVWGGSKVHTFKVGSSQWKVASRYLKASTNRQGCIIAAGVWGGSRALLKNRDRNYTPKLKVYHQVRDGVEVLYMKDEITGWVEGLNEFGIGVVNSALSVARDEAEKVLVKSKGKKSKDGERVLKALAQKDLDAAVEVACNFKGGIKGHTFVSNPDTTKAIEQTSKHDCVVKTLANNRVHVRSNHGMAHEDAGYTDGENYVSSVYRRDRAKETLRGLESTEEIAPAMYQKHKGDGEHNSMVRKTDNMRTSSQMVLDLTQKIAHLYLLPGEVEFEGLEEDLPKGFQPKLMLKVYDYDTPESFAEAKAVQRKVAGLLPIMRAGYNLREMAKQLLLLEDHLFHPRKRCKDCIRKHILTAEALAEETVSLDDGTNAVILVGLADQIREVWAMVQDVEDAAGYVGVAQKVRAIRKALVDVVGSVRVAGMLMDFPEVKRPVSNTHFYPLHGKKYVLSDDPGNMVAEVSGEEDPEGGATLIETTHPQPYRFLWAYDMDKGDVLMWRVTDGVLKVVGPAYRFEYKLLQLDRLGELNRIPHAEVNLIGREMFRIEDKHLESLKQHIEESKDDFQKQVDRITKQVFDEEILPSIKKSLSDLKRGVVPFGFKVNERMLSHKDAESQMRHHVVQEALKPFKARLVEKRLRSEGLDPDAPGVDNQAAYWAVHDVIGKFWGTFESSVLNRVASRYLGV